MTKRDRLIQTVQGVQTGLAALVVILVTATGLCIIGALLTAEPGVATSTTSASLSGYPDSPGTGQQSMTPNGHPIPDGAASLILPVIHKTDNSEKRPDSGSHVGLRSHRLADIPVERRTIYTSLSEIDSHLGRQLTLVGAKPSGLG